MPTKGFGVLAMYSMPQHCDIDYFDRLLQNIASEGFVVRLDRDFFDSQEDGEAYSASKSSETVHVIKKTNINSVFVHSKSDCHAFDLVRDIIVRNGLVLYDIM